MQVSIRTECHHLDSESWYSHGAAEAAGEGLGSGSLGRLTVLCASSP